MLFSSINRKIFRTTVFMVYTPLFNLLYLRYSKL
nr:MAG TPA: hypothetical protein [Bacteriophage sp.]